MLIYHLTSRAAWDRAREVGFYVHQSLEEAGFIHCSTAEQLLPVANTIFGDMESPVVLRIETARVDVPVSWEAPDPDDPFAAERFPHVYGPINLEAVVAVMELRRGPDGSYTGFGTPGR